jgi:acyl-CoA synthetase (NDP forming)
VVADVLRADPGGSWVDASRTQTVLTSYGIATAPVRAAASAAEAVARAAELGYPVVMKTDRADIIHKTDVAGVRVGLADADQVAEAYDELVARLGGAVLLQPTVEAGAELVVGVTRESSFGPVAMVGLGGVLTELLGDVALRLLPLRDRDVSEMLAGLRAAPLLTGYRGSPPLDVAGVEDLLLRVSALAEEVPEVAELDLNPVMVSGTGAVVVDAKLRLAPPPETPDELARKLRR